MKRALLALHSPAALQPQSLKRFYLFLWLTSPKLSWLFKMFLQQKNHPFCYPTCFPPSRSPQAEVRGALSSSLPWFWTSNGVAGRTHTTTSSRPSANPIFHHPKKQRGHAEHPAEAQCVLSTFRCSQPAPVLVQAKGLRRGCTHSRAGTGAALLWGGYWLLSGYWCDPKELCLV